MENSNPVDTPLAPGEKLSKSQSPITQEDRAKMNVIPYQEAVGSLLFAAQISRPDISYAVSCVSRFNQNPGQAHWVAVKRILRYLKGTIDWKLQFNGAKINGPEIIGYCDADWASDQDDRRSITGYIFLKNNSPISWNSRKQQTVALSTTEAEYMAMSSATQEALWLRFLSNELSGKSDPVLLNVDNQGAQNLALNGCYQARTKHIDVRHHFLKEKINMGILCLQHVSTNNMLADSFTKALNRTKFLSCIKGQGLISNREGVVNYLKYV